MTVRYRLDNGLTVVFDELHASKVAAFQLWVKAGSADEREDQAGLAHLHEHMLFKGTTQRATGEIAHEIEAHGGEINAWTSLDQTVYHVVIASQYAQRGLAVLSDAVRNSVFDPEELAKEIEVVCEEINRSQDMPSRRASKDLFATAFQTHPYRRPVIGWAESVRSFTRQKVLEFYQRHYTPHNMVLAAAGDLSEQQLRAWVDENLGGDWGRPFKGRVERPQEPKLSHRRFLLREDDVREAYLNLGFQIPSIAHEDTPVLDLLALIAGQGDASRLTLEVKRKRALVNEVHAYAYTPNDPGLWGVSLTAPAPKLASALEQVARVIVGLRQDPVGEDELSTAKALVESEAIYQRETAQGVARKLGYYEAAAGGLEKEAAYYEQIAAVTPAKLLEVSRQYLDFDRLVMTGLLPKGTALSQTIAEELLEGARRETQPPVAARRVPKQMPTPLRVTSTKATQGASKVLVEKLPSGASVIVREERAVPLFAMRAVFPGGLRYENETNNGLTTLLSRLLTRGTGHHDAEEISNLIDDLSGSLSGAGGRNSISLRGEFLSKHFERAFALFTDCLSQPAFPEPELARERQLLLQDIATREDKPSGVAFDLFARTLYEKHPYRLSALGEAPSVERLTREDLAGYHAHFMDPSQLVLCVVGDVQTDRVLELAHEAFGKSRGEASVPPPVPEEPLLTAPRKAKRQLPRAQSHVVLGFPGARVTDPWRRALDVLSTVLSGQGGRLFVELRDKRSMAYSVSSLSMEGVDPGYFAVYIATSPEKVDAAVEGIHAELSRLRSQRIEAAELERAKRHLIGTHEIGLQRNGARAALMALDHCYGLGAEHSLSYARNVQAVTAEEVHELAKRLLDPARCAISIVGP